MSKELESAIRYVSECLEQDDNPDHCDIREILAAARQTLGRADDSEPFTLADWEALRYPKKQKGEIVSRSFYEVGFFTLRNGENVILHDGCEMLTNPTKHEARTLLEILCGKEPDNAT